MASDQDLTIKVVTCSGPEFQCPAPGCLGRVVGLIQQTIGAPDCEPPDTSLCSITGGGSICCPHLVLVQVEQE